MALRSEGCRLPIITFDNYQLYNTTHSLGFFNKYPGLIKPIKYGAIAIAAMNLYIKAAGAVRLALSSTSPTSAILREGRLPEPEKITSSMPDARMDLYELSPITQRIASTRLDLPQPFGPTMPVNPDSI